MCLRQAPVFLQLELEFLPPGLECLLLGLEFLRPMLEFLLLGLEFLRPVPEFPQLEQVCLLLELVCLQPVPVWLQRLAFPQRELQVFLSSGPQSSPLQLERQEL